MHRRSSKPEADQKVDEDSPATQQTTASLKHFYGNSVAVMDKHYVLGLMSTFFLFHVGTEFSILSYLPSFASILSL